MHTPPPTKHAAIRSSLTDDLKMKILITYQVWSKCVPMNLKRTPLTFKIKLTHNFGPLSITFSLKCLFSAKMAILCVFGCIEHWEPKQFQSKWHRWFFLVHWNTFYHNQIKIQNFHFLHFYRSLWGYVKSSDPLYRGFQWDDFKILIIYDIVQSLFIF